MTNKVFAYTPTIGTGSITLGNTVTGFRNFSSIFSGQIINYEIDDFPNWELGTGTWDGVSQLTRNPIDSSSSGSLISLSGNAVVTVISPSYSPTLATGPTGTHTVSANDHNSLMHSFNATGGLNVVFDPTASLPSGLTVTLGKTVNNIHCTILHSSLFLVPGGLYSNALNIITEGKSVKFLFDGTNVWVLDHTLTTNFVYFTSNGTYIPTLGTVMAQVELWGGGAGGGGISSISTVGGYLFGGGGGGGSGAYSMSILNGNQIGLSGQPVIVGSAGIGVNAANGTNGTITTFGGTIVTAPGGSGGQLNNMNNQFGQGGLGAVGGTANFALGGIAGSQGFCLVGYANGIPYNVAGAPPFVGISGAGAQPPLMSGGAGPSIAGFSVSVANPGIIAGEFGSGGSGASFCSNAAITGIGGNGTPGIVKITEYGIG